MPKKNTNLRKANKGKNDEFYTQIGDITNELKHYKEHFKGKTVLCNCDDPRVSHFFHYFSYSFEQLGLKRLITTCYKNQNPNLFSMHKSEKAVYLIYDGDKNGNHTPDAEEIGVHEFKGDGDFRSDECIELLKQADIVVTNPPFSLFREYIAQLIKYEKKFLVLGNMNAISYKEIFPLIKDNKIWTGYGFNMSMVYKTTYPNLLEANRKFVIGKGYNPDDGYVKVPAICRFTNLDIKKRHEDLIMYKQYNNSEYPKYDNYDAINIDKVSDIPYDYPGIMGVPITFLDKYNPEQFDIIDALNRYAILDSNGKNEEVRKKHSHMCNINGIATYYRLLIRRKK